MALPAHTSTCRRRRLTCDTACCLLPVSGDLEPGDWKDVSLFFTPSLFDSLLSACSRVVVHEVYIMCAHVCAIGIASMALLDSARCSPERLLGGLHMSVTHRGYFYRVGRSRDPVYPVDHGYSPCLVSKSRKLPAETWLFKKRFSVRLFLVPKGSFLVLLCKRGFYIFKRR